MIRFLPLLVALGLSLVPASATAQEKTDLERKDVARVNIIDVGQGDAILIRSPKGKTALIDAGPSHHIVQLLRDLGVTSQLLRDLGVTSIEKSAAFFVLI